MANLYSGHIDTKGEYESVETLTGLTFTSGTTYTIQCLDNAYVREGEIGTGFRASSKLIQYTAGDDTLYIKGDCHINIAE